MKNIISQFNTDCKYRTYEKHGEGHINDTYLIHCDDGAKYILQRVNERLFTDIEKLMSNIEKVTEFCALETAAEGGDPKTECLLLIKTNDGKNFYKDKTGSYRMYNYIDGVSHQTASKPELFYESAVAFSKFQQMLSKFDASQLYEILPGFHNTVKRYENFENAVKADSFNRAAQVKAEIDFVIARKKYCSRIVDLLESGEMPLRVTHNDTKLNNVMMNKATEKGLAVIDLDTVMPGSVCYDFGDSIRFGCNPAAEDERDLSKVVFQIDLFESFTKGFLSVLKLTKSEIDNLAFSAILMTYECGMRFLTDFLEGDVYFRTNRAGQNLDRARTQFKLIEDMEKVFDQMQKIVLRYA